jgi:sucrose-6-phosphate hydrolase SacC (GH32 family)
MNTVIKKIKNIVIFSLFCGNFLQAQNLERETSSLAAYWRFDESAGTFAIDAVSGANDSINEGYRGVIWRKGVAGNALDLDGSFTNVVRSAGELPEMSDEFTIEGWFGVRSWPVNDVRGSADFASFLSCYDDSNGIRFGLDKFGNWGVKIGQEGRWNEYWASSKVAMMQWSHLVVTFRKNNSVKLYQNGKMVGKWKALNRPFHLPLKSLHIGTDNEISYSLNETIFPNNLYNGLMDELKIYHRVLDPDEIWQSYTGNLPVATNPADIEVSPERFARDNHRPRYHAMPAANWTNEMHGLIYYKGRYHLFHQANPNGVFIEHMRWGHLVSDDLVHWIPQPLILCPDSETSIDRWGCWSGGVTEKDNQLKLIYTPVDYGCARIGLATVNSDEISATKYSGNPVIETLGHTHPLYKDFRDPFVWKTGPYWYMIIGSGLQIGGGQTGGGTALLYRSDNLTEWTYLKPILADNTSIFWEVPCFAYLGNGKSLLYASRINPFTSSYWIGTWENETFTPDDDQPEYLDPFEKYCTRHNHQIGASPAIDKNGKLVTMHIINDCRSGKEQFKAGWAHNFSLPREWFLRQDNTLGQRPYEGLVKLRDSHDVNAFNIPVTVNGAAGLPAMRGDMMEIRMTVKMLDAPAFGIKLRKSPDEKEVTLIKYQRTEQKFIFDLSRSSLDPNVFRGMEQGDFFLDSDEALDLHIFLDKSMIEIFVNEREVFTARVYPTREDSRIVEFFTEGSDALIKQIDVWQIER